MDLDSIGLIVPIVAVLFFLLLEKNNNHKISIFDGRGKSILTIELLSLLLSLILASVLLLPLVMSISNLQIFSMSQLQLPTYVTFALSFLLIDFINYINHRVHHKIPFLWRFHRLHHSDKKINALTTWLHHPFEIISTFVIVITLYVLFDIPVIVMVIYGIVFGAHAAFTHFNILMPESINKHLQKIIVTPNAHMVHHALDIQDGNSNFGQLFLFWDWIFGTYKYRSNVELNAMEYGIDASQSPQRNNVRQYLVNPFK